MNREIYKPSVISHFNHLIERYPQLEECRNHIIKSFGIIKDCYDNGGKLLIAGNGGSAADSEHIVGELMKSFVLPRTLSEEYQDALVAIDTDLGNILAKNLQCALPAIALNGHFALTTAYMNDREPQLCFAQQVNGFGTKNDVFFGISTSGKSKNILYAAVTARAKGMKIIGLTGESENPLMRYADVCIRVPEKETFKIQELHLPVYHCLCLMLEAYFFDK